MIFVFFGLICGMLLWVFRDAVGILICGVSVWTVFNCMRGCIWFRFRIGVWCCCSISISNRFWLIRCWTSVTQLVSGASFTRELEVPMSWLLTLLPFSLSAICCKGLERERGKTKGRDRLEIKDRILTDLSFLLLWCMLGLFCKLIK